MSVHKGQRKASKTAGEDTNKYLVMRCFFFRQFLSSLAFLLIISVVKLKFIHVNFKFTSTTIRDSEELLWHPASRKVTEESDEQ